MQGLFLAITLLTGAAVGWLGWRLLTQDRALARQRRLEQLEAAADRVAGALYRNMAEFEELLLIGGRRGLPEGAVLLRAQSQQIAISPSDGLLYLPVLPPPPTIPDGLFTNAEALEFQRMDFLAAASALRRLAASDDRFVRAAALARLARNWKKAGRPDEALAVYAQLATLGTTMVDGLPAHLVALEGRCALFHELRSAGDLEREAGFLHNRLMSGEWSLVKSSYEFQVAQARRWLRLTPEADGGGKEALSAAAELLWQAWRKGSPPKGRTILGGERAVLAAWSSDGEEWTAVLAPALALDAALLEAGSFETALIDDEGHLLLGRINKPARLRVERSQASTKLPWTVLLTSRDDGTDELAGRHRLLGGGLAMLVALLAAAGFIVSRAVSKEMAVAQLQTDFVAAVSHEFRSPLASISQIAELLDADRWPTPDHRRRGQEILTRETARLRRLVEGLLDFARMEAGTAGYRLASLDGAEMVRGVVNEFQASANGSQIEISIATGLPHIRGDREALSRALWNLLENAVKYSAPPARVWVETSARDGVLAIRVRDEGTGIPGGEQAQIFNKFYRGSEAKARGVRGTGLGLAMVRHIVEGHGGEIRVESEPGRGSTFTLILPGGEPA